MLRARSILIWCIMNWPVLAAIIAAMAGCSFILFMGAAQAAYAKLSLISPELASSSARLTELNRTLVIFATVAVFLSFFTSSNFYGNPEFFFGSLIGSAAGLSLAYIRERNKLTQ